MPHQAKIKTKRWRFSDVSKFLARLLYMGTENAVHICSDVWWLTVSHEITKGLALFKWVKKASRNIDKECSSSTFHTLRKPSAPPVTTSVWSGLKHTAFWNPPSFSKSVCTDFRHCRSKVSCLVPFCVLLSGSACPSLTALPFLFLASPGLFPSGTIKIQSCMASQTTKKYFFEFFSHFASHYIGDALVYPHTHRKCRILQYCVKIQVTNLHSKKIKTCLILGNQHNNNNNNNNK